MPPEAFGAEDRVGQLDHLVVVARPQRLGVDAQPQRSEARHVVGMDDLQVRQVVASAGGPVCRARGLDGVQTQARGGITDHVQVQVESRGIQGRRDGKQDLAFEVLQARVFGGVRGAIAGAQVGFEHGGALVFGYAVDHDLGAGGAEPCCGIGEAAGQEVLDKCRDVLQGCIARNPQCSGCLPGQQSLGNQAAVGGGDIRVSCVGAKDCFLPAGDAEGMQVGLSGKQAGAQGGCLGARDELGDQIHGALMQGAGGVAEGVAFKAPVGRVRCLGGDARELQGRAVDPGAVVVAVQQVCRAVRNHCVELFGCGVAAGEIAH